MGPTLVDFYRIGFGLWALPCMAVVVAPYVAVAAVVAMPALVAVAVLSDQRR